ncbi:MAG TPA: HlyD family efflux transporter periplasmic adaptor subunit [Methylococcaceae bacterium]|nr:HlyD family efflux transporter periplasmic adaptor subunit [Methylococcaceae bacterium]
MSNLMTKSHHHIGLAFFVCMLLMVSNLAISSESSGSEQATEEPEKGSHRGRLLKDGGFIIELSIFETGVPPEFRVWITDKGQSVKPSEVSLNIKLTRLGGIEDNINFTVQDDFLRGDMEIYEPHSFVVTVNAQYQGQSHQWQYDNFEGRTLIEPKVAEALEIGTSIAGSALLKETVAVYGKLIPHPDNSREISARFQGAIKRVHVSFGQKVKKGQSLATVESNESLKSYTIFSPINGVIRQQQAHSGEQTKDQVLFSIVDHSVLMAELAVFPSDRHRIALGATVLVTIKGLEQPVTAVIKQIDPVTQPNQSVLVRAELNNKNGQLVSGVFVSADIEVAEFQVPLAVKRSGLQGFRDFTVVFVKIGSEYEVRMLELGRIAGEWIEVLGGLKVGSEYVSENSYIIKADIEKSGAVHDH